MRLWQRLLLTLLAVAVLPLVLITRHDFAFFHDFTKRAQEREMVVAAQLMAELFHRVSEPAERAAVLDAHAVATGSRLRYFDASLRMVYDSGATHPVDLSGDPEVARAFETGRYAARWALSPDRLRLHYFAAVPRIGGKGEVLGVAQVIRDTREITFALARLRRNQRLAAAWAAVLSVFLALFSSWALTRRLRRLRRSAARFAHSGDPSGFALSGGDEVAELAGGFREMAVELGRRQAYNRDFVLTTLHELKTPLTAVRGAAGLMLAEPSMPPSNRERFTRNIAHQAERMAALVRDLHSLTSLDLDLPAEVPCEREAGELFRDLLQKLGASLRAPVELAGEGGEARVCVRADRIEQVLANLLGNAQRYHPADGSPIRVRLRAEAGFLEVTVEDKGPGIAPENLDRVFERFFTTVPRGEGGEEGRGLGLAVVRRIVEHHRGMVFARNRPEGGAAVGFLLPLAAGG